MHLRARIIRLLLGRPLGIAVVAYPPCGCGCTPGTVALGIDYAKASVASHVEFSLGQIADLRDHLGDAIMAASEPS
jgi:hypothetical protein